MKPRPGRPSRAAPASAAMFPAMDYGLGRRNQGLSQAARLRRIAKQTQFSYNAIYVNHLRMSLGEEKEYARGQTIPIDCPLLGGRVGQASPRLGVPTTRTSTAKFSEPGYRAGMPFS